MGLKEVEDILRDVDLNGDGLVDFEGKVSEALPRSSPSPPLLYSASPHHLPSSLPHRVCADDVTLSSAQATREPECEAAPVPAEGVRRSLSHQTQLNHTGI